jgi:uncharacterized protein DUF559
VDNRGRGPPPLHDRLVELPDPDWYLDNVLAYAEPGMARLRRPGPAEIWSAWWDGRADGDDPLTALLRTQGFVATAAQLASCGITRQTTRTRIRRGAWSRPAHGVIAPLDVGDDDARLVHRRRHALAASAAVLRRPAQVVSGRSAAVLRGLPVFELPDRPETTDAHAGRWGPRGASHVHPARLSGQEVTSWFGVPVTTVARTLVDLGRHDRRDAIMAADAALREDLVTRAEIDAALAAARGWPGVRPAREVLALADPRAESPLESLARLVMHDDGLPAPELQVSIGGYKVDMLFDEQRLIVEIDGLDKYSGNALQREKRRERRLRRHGYRVERLTWDDLVHRWPETRVWLRAALGLPA